MLLKQKPAILMIFLSPSSQTEIILVQNSMMVSADAGNKMPFSWRIKEYLDEMWLKAQYIQNTEGEHLA